MNMYLVGGFVRDELLGLHSKDIDFAVEAQSFDAMRSQLLEDGFEIFLETPEHLTIRARFPRRKWTFAGRDFGSKTCDFVLCRRDGAYSDGRRPDEVFAGTLLDDLARRDFTINAMALDLNGRLIDPHDGMEDIRKGSIRCVGTARERFTEDSLRALRAIRFSITKHFWICNDVELSLYSDWLPPLLKNVSVERRREELLRCFKHSTLETLQVFNDLPTEFTRAVFAGGLWLKPTLES